MCAKITVNETLAKLDRLPSKPEDFSEDDIKFYSVVGMHACIRELELLIKEKKWVFGVMMSASMLEFVGKKKLIWKHKGSIPAGEIENFSLAKTNVCLFTSGIIKKSTYEKIKRVKGERNALAHRVLRQILVARKNEKNPHLESIIRDAIEIIKVLFS